jgi:hypothetical protein
MAENQLPLFGCSMSFRMSIQRRAQAGSVLREGGAWFPCEGVGGEKDVVSSSVANPVGEQ